MKNRLLRWLLSRDELRLLSDYRTLGNHPGATLDEDDYNAWAHFLSTNSGRRIDAAMKALVAGKCATAVWGTPGDEPRGNATARGFASCWGSAKGLAMRATAQPVESEFNGEDARA